jgi:gas vesicle protein
MKIKLKYLGFALGFLLIRSCLRKKEKERRAEDNRRKSMSRNNEKKGFVLGALFGGLVGSVAALLLAPKSGDRLRRDLSRKYQCISEKTCEMMDGVCEQTCELVEKAKEIACSAKEAASKIYKGRDRD